MFPPFRPSVIGPGMVIGTNGVIHMVIAQGIAVGLFAVLGLLDWYAMRQGEARAADWRPLLRRLLTFSAITTTIAGAATGAGIWFTIGSLAPRATASMLRVFFWPWLTEWFAFIGEVVVVLILYAAWDWLEHWRRLRVGLSLAYAAYTVASAFLITGIIGFMLTSGQWPENPNLLTGFFNPSFLPQLICRLALSVVIGSAMAMGLVVLSRLEPAVRGDTLRVLGVALVVAVAVLVPSLGWYLAVVPNFYTTRSVYAVLTQHLAQTPLLFYLGNLAALVLVLLLAVAGMLRSRRATGWLVVPSLVLLVGFVAEFERIREFIRGPYLMPGHMYVSEVLMSERFLFDDQGLLPNHYWYQKVHAGEDLNQAGAYLFERSCGVCHTIGGINDIKLRIAGRPLDALEVLIGRTHEMASFMPPFAGDATERRVLAQYLYRLGQGTVDMASRSRALVGRAALP